MRWAKSAMRRAAIRRPTSCGCTRSGSRPAVRVRAACCGSWASKPPRSRSYRTEVPGAAANATMVLQQLQDLLAGIDDLPLQYKVYDFLFTVRDSNTDEQV